MILWLHECFFRSFLLFDFDGRSYVCAYHLQYFRTETVRQCQAYRHIMCNILLTNVTHVYKCVLLTWWNARSFGSIGLISRSRRSPRSPAGSCPPTSRNELRLPIPGHITVPWPFVKFPWWLAFCLAPRSIPCGYCVFHLKWFLSRLFLTPYSIYSHDRKLTILRRISAHCWKAPWGLGEACVSILTCTGSGYVGMSQQTVN